MGEFKNKKLIKWLVAVAVVFGGSLVAFAWRYNNFPTDILPPDGMEINQVMWALSDGFFIVGMLCTCLGLLMWISTTGALDMITYGFKSLLYLFTPYQKDKDEGGFYEYKLAKKEKRKAAPLEYLFLGLGAVVLALIFGHFSIK